MTVAHWPGLTVRDRASVAIVAGLCAVDALVHLALVDRYGYHGDELYFLDCGRHLAFGYVDHPPLIPWLAALADLAGGSLLALRLPAIAASVGTLALTGALVRVWGGGPRAQLVALLALLVAPANLRMGAMLDIPVVETALCTSAAWLVARALARDGRWTWVLAGATLGLAALAKHSALLWGAALLVGLLATPERRVLARPWPWLGAVVAGLLVLPNGVWQVQHGFPTLEFLRTLRAEVLAEQGRVLFVAGQVLYFHPIAVAVWIAGLAYAWTPAGRATRPFAILFTVLFAFFLVAGGKPYYLASAYPPMLAAGGIGLERWLAAREGLWRALVGSLASTGVALAVLTLPVLPIRTVDAWIGALLGWAVPPMALTHDLHGMYGWAEQAATVDRVYRSLPSSDRDRAVVLTGTYAQAGAVNRFATEAHAVSGHMTYFLWGPDADRGEVLIVYGLAIEPLASAYASCVEVARIDAPLARPHEADLPVYVCRGANQPLAALWPTLRRFGHLPAAPIR